MTLGGLILQLISYWWLFGFVLDLLHKISKCLSIISLMSTDIHLVLLVYNMN